MVGVGGFERGVDVGGLTEVVDRLAAIDKGYWPDVAVADTFIEVRREIDRLESVAAGLLVAVEGRQIPYGDGATSVSAWAQWRTGQRWSEAKASFDAGVACEQLPLTAKAWAQGEISASTARSICRGLRAGHEEVYREVEEALVHFAAERNISDLDGLIAYYRKCCDAVDDREPAEKNGVHLSPVDGRWVLNGDLDALGGKTLDRAIEAALDIPSDSDDTRSPARRRADALTRIARFFLDHEHLPIEGGEAPHVSLTISWEMRRALARRDRHCRYPGCSRKVSWCEAHHVIAWWNGGNTALDNVTRHEYDHT
jgi:hypothetical protein